MTLAEVQKRRLTYKLLINNQDIVKKYIKLENILGAFHDWAPDVTDKMPVTLPYPASALIPLQTASSDLLLQS